MIVVDTSALIAIVQKEPDSQKFRNFLRDTPRPIVGTPTSFEAHLVASRHPEGVKILQGLFAATGCLFEPWTEQHADAAFNAFLHFGKGRGHPANLNFGDCMAYTLAKSLDAPLLFKGDDFRHTDVRDALA